MRYLQRYLSEDMTNDTMICTSLDCLHEYDTLDSCSYICLNDCPFICKVIEITNLSPPPPLTHHDHNLKRNLIIMASSIITTLFLLTLLLLCFKFYQRSRRSRISRRSITRRWSMDQEARNWNLDGPSPPVIVDHPVWHIRTIGLNPTVINSIKACKYSKKDGLVEGTDCSVCLSEFEEEEMLRLLPKCRHAFHLTCIDTWLRSHTNCPVCRAPIVTMNDEDGSECVEEEILVRVQEQNGEDVERDLEEERDGFVSNVGIDCEGEERQNRVRRSMSLDLRVSVGREKEKRSSFVGMSSFLKRSISYSGK
ncbi:unnamed protein product [Cochlearia groenlandica]